jgi:hypothetical protein
MLIKNARRKVAGPDSVMTNQPFCSLYYSGPVEDCDIRLQYYIQLAVQNVFSNDHAEK